MNSTGIIRGLDSLGRVVLPIELRRSLDISHKDSLEIFIEGDTVMLRKYRPECMFCDEAKNIISFHGKNICPACIRRLNELL